MSRIWTDAVEPMLDAIAPRVIAAVAPLPGGAEDWARAHDAKLVIVEPGDGPDALGSVVDVDVALLGSDPNWYAVHRALTCLRESATGAGRTPPIVFVGGVDWPTGRRDGYHDPTIVPQEFRHPHALTGIGPGDDPLQPHGLLADLHHALAEGGEHNGVRTAVEDYLASVADETKAVEVAGEWGLAVLVPDAARTSKIDTALKRLRSVGFLRERVLALDAERVAAVVRGTQAIARANNFERLRVDAERKFADAETAQREAEAHAREVEDLRDGDRAALADAQQRWADAERRADSLTAEATRLRTAIAEAAGERARLEAALAAGVSPAGGEGAEGRGGDDLTGAGAGAGDEVLRARLDLLTGQLEAARAEADELRASAQSAVIRARVLEEETDAARVESRRLANNLATARSEVEELTLIARSEEKQAGFVGTEAGVAADEFERVKAELATAQSALAQRDADLAAARNGGQNAGALELEAARTQARYESELRELEKAAAEARSERDAARAERDLAAVESGARHESERRTLEFAAMEAQSRYEADVRELERTTAQLRSEGEAAGALSERALTELRARHEAEVQTLEQAVAEARAERDEARAELEVATAQARAERKAVGAELEREAVEARTRHEAALQLAEVAVAEARAERDAARAELERETGEVGVAREAALAESERILAEVRAERDAAQAESEQAAADARTARETARAEFEHEVVEARARHEADLRVLENTAAEARIERDEARADLDGARQAAVRAEHAREALEGSLQDREQQVHESVREQLEHHAAIAEQSRAEATRLRAELQEHMTAADEERRRRAGMERALGTAQGRLDAVRAERDALARSLRDSQHTSVAAAGRGLESDAFLADLRGEQVIAQEESGHLAEQMRRLRGGADVVAPEAMPAASAPAAALAPVAVEPTEPLFAEPVPAAPMPPEVPAASPAPAPAAPHPSAAALRDAEARIWLAESYRDTLGHPVDAPAAQRLGLPFALDRRGSLSPLERERRTPDEPTVDVVVCVHNALDDVRRCLRSVTAHVTHPVHLIVVDDGSKPETTHDLRETAAELGAGMTLIENPDSPHGYTIAANLGLRASRADYVILLNSDTIVTSGWLERIVAAGEADQSIGLLGPLSNAASHQSVPLLRDPGKDGWAINPLPAWLTPDGVSAVVGALAPGDRPRLSFLNGFCYAIKRRVIDDIGYLDEERFASGYCEENDFSHRARLAGYELAVVDDAYVFHAKSKSYSPEGRDQLSKRNRRAFMEKHGPEEINRLVMAMEKDMGLEPVRRIVADAIKDPSGIAAALHQGRRPLNVMFILPGLSKAGSGGSHSVYQEVRGMRELGVPATIALAAKVMDRAREAYSDADELFVPFSGPEELAAVTAKADVISATHFKSVEMLAELYRARQDFLPAYYVQDYEPFFSAVDPAEVAEAKASYTLVPDLLLFAKTHWLCNVVALAEQVRVSKVEPSIDRDVYAPRGRRRGAALRVAAMVRPRTPRRQAATTVEILERLDATFGDAVETVTFGCTQAELEALTDSRGLLDGHQGLLRRDEVADLLGSSHVFLDVSTYQAFGRTALEAMACGATAVVPRVGGVVEFARDGENALVVDTHGPEDAVRALSSLVKDREMLRSLQAEARRTASAYSIPRAALSEYLLFVEEYRRRFADVDTGAAQTGGTTF